MKTIRLNDKIIANLLSSKYSKSSDLKKFIIFTKNLKLDLHKLFSFKQLSKELTKRLRILKTNDYFIDPIDKNDHEWGTLKRIYREFISKIIFFMNDFSYPITSNWLKYFNKFKKIKW